MSWHEIAILISLVALLMPSIGKKDETCFGKKYQNKKGEEALAVEYHFQYKHYLVVFFFSMLLVMFALFFSVHWLDSNFGIVSIFGNVITGILFAMLFCPLFFIGSTLADRDGKCVLYADSVEFILHTERHVVPYRDIEKIEHPAGRYRPYWLIRHNNKTIAIAPPSNAVHEHTLEECMKDLKSRY